MGDARHSAPDIGDDADDVAVMIFMVVTRLMTLLVMTVLTCDGLVVVMLMLGIATTMMTAILMMALPVLSMMLTLANMAL